MSFNNNNSVSDQLSNRAITASDEYISYRRFVTRNIIMIYEKLKNGA